jgi:hypothetical protein
MATEFHSYQARDILLHMAQVWLRLAHNYEDANKSVGPPRLAEEARPVVQQQQQIRPREPDL